MAASPQATAEMTKAIDTDGPAVVAATRAVRVKMPAPMTTATPKIVRSQADRVRLSLCPGSSVSWIDCSTDFVRHNPLIARPFDARRWHAGRDSITHPGGVHAVTPVRRPARRRPAAVG